MAMDFDESGERTFANNIPKKRVLSIQSHVVSGYVGNKAAVFPLQLLGFDVDVVNSVQFSNHVGYEKGYEGEVLKGDQLRSLLAGLKRNGLLNHVGHLLTGYIGSESFLKAVLDVVKTIRAANGTFRYVCDPVLGDKGRFYVPKELVKVFCEQLIPHADVLTPNDFEVEQLTGIKVTSIENARRACALLHEMGPRLIFVTSFSDEHAPGTLMILASQRKNNKSKGAHEEDEVWKMECPIVPGYFTGTGDLCASLLLAHTADERTMLSTAMEKVINTMYAVIERTHQLTASRESMQSRELRVIQSKLDIENPPQRFKATRIK